MKKKATTATPADAPAHVRRLVESLLHVPFSPLPREGAVGGYNRALRVAFMCAAADAGAREAIADWCEAEDLTLLELPRAHEVRAQDLTRLLADLGYELQRAANRCRKCGATFATKQKLKRHQERVTPCVPVIPSGVAAATGAGAATCRFCGRAFSRQDSLKRHFAVCKVSNSDEGMQNLRERIVAQQAEQFDRELALRDARLATLEERLTEMTRLLQQRGGEGPAPAPTQVAPAPPGDPPAVAPAGGLMAYAEGVST